MLTKILGGVFSPFALFFAISFLVAINDRIGSWTLFFL